MRSIYFIAAIILFFSACKSEEEKAIQGFWNQGQEVLFFENDTLTLLPEVTKFTFEVDGEDIILTEQSKKSLALWFDLEAYPRFYGKIIHSDSGYVISVPHCGNFTRFYANNRPRKLNKLQFTFGGWNAGYSFEMDTLGNTILTMHGYFENYASYSHKLPSEDVASILSWYSFVQADSLKLDYREGCADCAEYMLTLFFDDDTVNCHVADEQFCCSGIHYSLSPLLGLLNYKTRSYANDTAMYQRVEKHFFYSKLLGYDDDVPAQIDYYREFDTLNYKQPHYDLSGLKKLVDKYYDFKDTHIWVDVTTDSTGKIVDVEFDNSEIETRKGFLAEVQRKLSAIPAVFNGKKIGIKDNIRLDYQELKE